MNKAFEKIGFRINSIELLAEQIKADNRTRIPVSSLPGSAKSIFVLSLFEFEKNLVLFLPDQKLVNETKVELDVLGLSEYIISIDEFDRESIQKSITELGLRNEYILISTYDLLRIKLPSRDNLKKKSTLIQIGGDIAYDELVEYLNLLHYQKEKYVENPGEFSVRGSIIDFWSYSEKQACRLEFDGDFLESIRHFDPESQRSSGKVESITLAASIDPAHDDYIADIFDYLNNPLVLVTDYELNNSLKDTLNGAAKIEDVMADIDDE